MRAPDHGRRHLPVKTWEGTVSTRKQRELRKGTVEEWKSQQSKATAAMSSHLHRSLRVWGTCMAAAENTNQYYCFHDCSSHVQAKNRRVFNGEFRNNSTGCFSAFFKGIMRPRQTKTDSVTSHRRQFVI